jgi:hypothetical protein
MRDRSDACRVLVGKPEWKETTWKNPGIDGRIILRYIFTTWDRGAWTGLIWLGIGTGGGIL